MLGMNSGRAAVETVTGLYHNPSPKAFRNPGSHKPPNDGSLPDASLKQYQQLSNAFRCQVFLTLHEDNPEGPRLLFEVSFDGSEGWQQIPTEVVPPAMLPDSLEHGAALRVKGKAEGILKATLRNRTWISMENLKQINLALGIQLSGDGSGKNKNYIKVDYAAALVNDQFAPDEISDQERSEITAAVTTKDRKLLTETEAAVLELFQHLDEEEKRTGTAAERLARVARERLFQNARRHGREEAQQEGQPAANPGAAGSEEATRKRKREESGAAAGSSAADPAPRRPEEVPRRVGVTPPTLRSLLPRGGRGIDSEISLNRDPTSYGYKALYPLGNLAMY